MPNHCRNQIRFFGTYETVAEVAMCLCQDAAVVIRQLPLTSVRGAFARIGAEGYIDATRVRREDSPSGGDEDSDSLYEVRSLGIQPVPGHEDVPGLVMLGLECQSAWSLPEALMQAIAVRFPQVIVGAIEDEPFNGVWSTCAWHASERFLALGSGNIPDDPTWQPRFDAAQSEHDEQALYEEHDERVLDFGMRTLYEACAARFGSACLPASAAHASHAVTDGWPRWSLLAHAADADGLQGLRRALPHLESTEAVARALHAERERACQAGVASWLDTALFGRVTRTDAIGGHPYVDLSLAGLRARHTELLEMLAGSAGGPEDRAFGEGLLQALADPAARSPGGLHVAVYLAASMSEHDQRSPAALEGLERLLGRLAERVPVLDAARALCDGDPALERLGRGSALLRSVLALAALPVIVQSQLKPADAAGVPAEFLLGTLVVCSTWASSGRPVEPARLLNPLVDLYGGAGKFPADLVQELLRVDPALHASYEAMKIAEVMRARIEAGATSAPAASASGQKRRAISL